MNYVKSVFKLSFATLVFLGVGVGISAEASAQKNVNVEAAIEAQFVGVGNSDSIIAFPNGTFLHGEVAESNINTTDIPTAYYNSDAASNAITVAEAKEQLKKNQPKGPQRTVLATQI